MKIVYKKIIFEIIILLVTFFASYNISLAAGCCIKNPSATKADANNCIKNVANAAACTGTFLNNDPSCSGAISVSYCSYEQDQNQVGCCIVDTKNSAKLGPSNCQSNKKRSECSGSNSLFDVGGSDCSELNSSFCKASGGAQIQDDSIPGTTESGGIIQCGRPGQNMCTLCDMIAGINTIIQYLMKIAIGAALLAIAIGGIMYIVSAGDPGLVENAKTTIKNAVIGFIIIFAGYIIINTTIVYLGTKSGMGINAQWGVFTCNSTAAQHVQQ
jgi:hypothetical protein